MIFRGRGCEGEQHGVFRCPCENEPVLQSGRTEQWHPSHNYNEHHMNVTLNGATVLKTFQFFPYSRLVECLNGVTISTQVFFAERHCTRPSP